MLDESDAALLAEMLCARVCHDLAGAVGAVTAGAELMNEEDPASRMAAEALDLMTGSAASLAARLRFLRLALGPANQSAVSQARGLTEAFFTKGHAQGGWSIDWPAAPDGDNSPNQIKLLLNLVLLAQDCLPKGGRIVVRPSGDELVRAEGEQATLGESAHGIAAVGLAGLGPRGMQGAYTALLAHRLNAGIEMRQQTGVICFMLCSPLPV